MDFRVTYPTWYLPEGPMAWGFSTTINIENPNPEEVTAKATYITADPDGGADSAGQPHWSEI
ncbi:MAG: hypothetical protein KKF41_16020 [Actinobacteria bacterium]|nr:hypothetical protein [Actinomycetota bacterium]MBU1944533.1 hypothetical protein [Actinomycetota bacterium]MBU2689086.1 hypothetical protein [Actinomycetota bacterium]